ncbi:MAG TPA: histidinol-phosphate transaminase [Solirubrobacteraceae bacterium]|nr:histidinol-phosphate transaminase [Solirubrobacteraceae bacterium]
MAIEFADRIRRIPVYPVAGGYATDEPLVLLASNESPYPPLRSVREAIDHELARLNRYPDPSSARLRRALADRYDVPVERIAVGNGSCDILLAAAEALLEPGAEIVYAWPSFSVYPQLAASSGARAITVGLDAEDRHDLPGMLGEITVATRLAIVCNPNNPTSTALPLAEIASFVDEVPPHVCVIVDEAYCEFNLLDDPDASIDLLARHPNLVLLRTFSKVHGLAGLRVGFALCGSEELPRALNQVRQPFGVNAAAQAAAVEALAHQDAVTDRVTKTIAERLAMDEGLAELGIEQASSQANFCWVHLGEEVDEAEVVNGLRERGVLVRAGAALGSDRPALRVTYGLPEENARFLEALQQVLAGAAARS